MKKEPFLTVFLCAACAALTVLFFAPMEVVLANAGEFFFPFSTVWWFQLLVTLAAALLLTGLAAQGIVLRRKMHLLEEEKL